MKFKDIAAQWLADKAQKVQPHSLETYRTGLSTTILPALGEKEEITEQDVQTFVETMKESGVKPSSYRNYINVARNILRFGAEKGWCHFPAWNSGLQSRKYKSDQEPVLLSTSQEEKLVKYLMGNPVPRNVGMLMSLMFGLRLGEVCELKWGEIDLKKDVVNVIEAPGQLRQIPIPLALPGFLQICSIGKEKGTYVCTGTTNPLPSPKSIRDSMKVVARNLDLPVRTFQDLRHNFTVRCIRSGCNFATLMYLLGYNNAQNLYMDYKPFFKTDTSGAMNDSVKALLAPSE